MNQDIKIITIGFGSIGQRHYKNLVSLGYKNIDVYDPADSQFKDKKIKRLLNLTSNALRQYEIAFICSPNSLHLSTAIKCAQAGCHLFIEKPLSHSLEGVDDLGKICQKNKLTVMVGHNMRFHPCLQFIKKYLDKNKLGKIYNINHEFGYYLPYWRPGQDYRKNYAAKKATGGGIILDDIHEFDLLFWLNNFAKITEAKFVYDKTSDLEITTEDNCLAIFKFSNKVLGLVKCDYLQKKYTRGCKIVGEKGNLEWDFNENVVWLQTKDKSKKIFEAKNFDFNQTYINEIVYFIKCVEARKSTFNDIKIAASILKYCVNKK